MNVEDCFLLHEPSSSSESGVFMEFDGGTIKLFFDYDKEGLLYTSCLQFNRVRSHKFTNEVHCPAWKIETSYDNLVKIVDSSDSKSLSVEIEQDNSLSWDINHFMIYFDSVGCYEVFCESWEVLEEVSGSLIEVKFKGKN